VITNTGTVTLSNVTVDEGAFTGSGSLSAPTCPADALSMAPSAQVTCTATYVLTQADIDAGQVTNDATATGTTLQGTAIDSNISEVTIPATQTPADILVKTVDSPMATTVGQTLTYTFTFTNIGNVTLTDVAIQEGVFSGTGSLSAIVCPPASSVLPGEVVTCTATYVVTAADLAAGMLTNTATASAVPSGGGPPIATDPSTAVVPAAAPKPPVPPTTTTTIPPIVPPQAVGTPPDRASSTQGVALLAATGAALAATFVSGLMLVAIGTLLRTSRRRARTG
jgi:uncharacterized repeat protein (TIGR01451 family)